MLMAKGAAYDRLL